MVSPERILAQTGDVEEQINLPPIAKESPVYPKLDTDLNQLAQGFRSMPQSDATQARTMEQATEPILVTFYVDPEKADDVRRYLEDNGVFVRNAGEDYIEAHVPPLMLGTASEQPGVLRVDAVVPPQPSQSETRVVSQGVGLHGADAWHDVGYRGMASRLASLMLVLMGSVNYNKPVNCLPTWWPVATSPKPAHRPLASRTVRRMAIMVWPLRKRLRTSRLTQLCTWRIHTRQATCRTRPDG